MKIFLISLILLCSVGCSPIMSGIAGVAAGSAGSSVLIESDLPPDQRSPDMIDTALSVAEPFVAGIPGVGAIGALLIGWVRNRRKWSALNADRAAHRAETANMQNSPPTHVVNVYINGNKVEEEEVDGPLAG